MEEQMTTLFTKVKAKRAELGQLTVENVAQKRRQDQGLSSGKKKERTYWRF